MEGLTLEVITMVDSISADIDIKFILIKSDFSLSFLK